MSVAARPKVGPGGPRSEPSSLSRLRQNASLRRLASIEAGMLVLAVMTGPQGSNSAPTSGFSGSLFHPRVFVFLGLGVALWFAGLTWRGIRGPVERGYAKVTAAPRRAYAHRTGRYGFYLLALAVAIILPAELTPYWQLVIVQDIGLYVLLAIGLNVVVGYAGLLDLGYAAFFLIGAYTTAYFTGALPVHPPVVLNPFLIIPIAIGAAMLTGVLLGTPTLRLRGDYLAIVTLGFGEVLQETAANLTNVTGGSQGAAGIPGLSLHLFGLNYQWSIVDNLSLYYLLLAFTIIAIFVFRSLDNSRVGRAWAAVREDEVAARSSGINPVKYKVMAFAIGASTGGFAGLFFATSAGYIAPDSFSVMLSINILVLVIFGGMGSLPGVVIGAALIQFIPEYLRIHPLFGFNPADLYIYLGALLVVMMIYRPQGIIPSRRRAREIELAEHGVGSADAMGGSG